MSLYLQRYQGIFSRKYVVHTSLLLECQEKFFDSIAYCLNFVKIQPLCMFCQKNMQNKPLQQKKTFSVFETSRALRANNALIILGECK